MHDNFDLETILEETQQILETRKEELETAHEARSIALGVYAQWNLQHHSQTLYEVADLMEEAYELDPEGTSRYPQWGMALHELGDYVGAWEAYNKLLYYASTAQDKAALFAQRGRNYFNMDRVDLAKYDFEEALHFNPESLQATLGLGDVFFTQAQFTEAYTMYRAAEELADSPEEQRTVQQKLTLLHHMAA